MSLRPAILLLLCAACGATGEPAFRAPLRARGAATELTVGAWTVTLTRAELGLGPLYLCATAAASSELCATAAAEFAAVAAVDLLDPQPQPLGELEVLPGQVRSAMLDYGVTWLKTQAKPRAQEGAPGGRAARFAGTAVSGDMSFEFTADLDVAPVLRGSRTLEGLRIGPFELDPGGALEVTVDGAAWWAGVEFDELAALGPGPHDLNALAAEDPASPAADALAAVRFAMIAVPPRLAWTAEE
ncbi:hypothetical protein [Nannocystis bainbridge]|uniref:Uncharacterized protein n=1 Tax=Nannocystis bainbridge TaxID=2995303 RepID=A0ABT5DZ16_9BACT|nr:hypothetical protein [Nannocystis bainbridge]MDC0718872.1 hypothetical protein [Nannocystis bainbridge]